MRGEAAAAAFPIVIMGVARAPDVAAKPKLTAASAAITNIRIESSLIIGCVFDTLNERPIMFLCR